MWCPSGVEAARALPYRPTTRAPARAAPPILEPEGITVKTRLVALTSVVLAGVLAPSAMGAVVLSDRECYREGARGTFVGSGFQPGQPVAVSLDGRSLGILSASIAGGVLAPINLGTIPRSEQTRALTMTQTTNPALTGTKTFRQTEVYVVTKPARFGPGRRLRIRAGGFYGAGQTLYAHVRGRTRRNVRIGRIAGACGKVATTRKVLLRRGDRRGFYTVQFDGVRRYVGRRAPLWVRITFRPIIRFSRSSPFSAPVLPASLEGPTG